MWPRFTGLDWPTPYGLLLALGCVLAWWLSRRRARQRGLDASHLDLALPLAFVAGSLLARVLGHWPGEAGLGAPGLAAEGRHRLYLVVLLVLPMLYAYGRAARLPLARYADALALPALVFMACVRVGCFLAGCCFGVPTDAPVAVAFPAGSVVAVQHAALGLVPPDAGRSLPVHAVQLYEVGALLVVMAALLRWRRRPRPPGREALLAFAAYALVAFALDFLRGDNVVVAAGLSAGQWHYLGWLLLAAALAGARPSASRWRP